MNRPKQRPVFHALWHLDYPATALTSVAHRISGIALFLLLPPVIYLFESSLTDEAGFARVVSWMEWWPLRLLLIAGLWALVLHLFAGIRFLLLDVEVGVAFAAARASAIAVNVAATLVTAAIAAGFFL